MPSNSPGSPPATFPASQPGASRYSPYSTIAVSPVVSDHYRCAPGTLVDTAENLSTDSGYFRFDDVVCFGRLAGGALSREPSMQLFDARSGVRSEGERISLPFDLSEVVSNLRHERYTLVPSGQLQRVAESRVARSVYNFVRPALQTGVRKHLQRAGLSGWDRIAFPRWPVDMTVESLFEKTLVLGLKQSRESRIPFIWFWPDGSQACAIMTHDVETAEGRDFCEQLMDLDEAHKIPAAFQVVPESRYEVSAIFLESLRKRGFEVNVHDLDHDGRLFEDRVEFDRRVARINEYALLYGSRGFRAGAMYRKQDWFGALDVSYDMSVPNVAHLDPQRGGCCTVFPYSVGGVLELPLTTTQDYALFHLLGDYSTSLWQVQAELILERHGLISFIAHPDYLIEQRARCVYTELLAYIARLRDERGVWVTVPGGVDTWWRNRRRMELVQVNGRWQATGPDSHRARVAFARLDGDRLVYDIEPGVTVH